MGAIGLIGNRVSLPKNLNFQHQINNIYQRVFSIITTPRNTVYRELSLFHRKKTILIEFDRHDKSIKTCIYEKLLTKKPYTGVSMLLAPHQQVDWYLLVMLKGFYRTTGVKSKISRNRRWWAQFTSAKCQTSHTELTLRSHIYISTHT